MTLTNQASMKMGMAACGIFLFRLMEPCMKMKKVGFERAQ